MFENRILTVLVRVFIRDVNLRYGLECQPRLVDIIAAVPHEYRKVLLPKLKVS